MPSYPSNVSLVTVTGYWSNSDGTGPATGWVSFVPNATLQDGTSNPANIVTPKALKATLVNGAITVQLMATDDSHLSPSGWTYTVVENIDSQSAVRSYSIQLPKANPTVDLSTLAPLATPPALVAYVALSAVGAVNGVASLDGTGNVPVGQLGNAPGGTPATAAALGLVQLAGDLGGTATAPTVPGLASKADDSAVVHLAGTEIVAGAKTFSVSPTIPQTPTAATDAASKGYVDTAKQTAIGVSLVNAIVFGV